MKIKHLAAILSISLATLSLAGCESEKQVNKQDIPTEINNYVKQHFPDNNILVVKQEQDGFRKNYEVMLQNNIKLEFNHKFEITDIDSNTKLPDSVIPEPIRNYVAQNYPDNYITDWELEYNHQQVGLDNGLDLEFTMDGNFIRIDN